MPLYALGLNHHSAPLAVRERLAFDPAGLSAALPELRCALGAEAAILSTCNRTELYLAGDRPERAAQWLAGNRRVGTRDLAPYLYALPEDQAVRHAFRVACGLDSMVLGETQILGQMKQAARAAETAGTLGSVLHKLFQRSFAVAKEVRSSTALGAGSVSMAAAAVRLAQRLFPSLRGERVLLVGAGEMIELCAAHFAAQSPAGITVANRTLERADTLAARHGGVAVELKALPELLHRHDIVITCTASSLPILGKGLIESALRARRRKPMFMVDLAVPRDVEPEAAELADVFLYSVDDLQEIVAEGRVGRRGSVAQAEAIVDAQVGQFMQWMEARVSAPLVRELREQADAARRETLARALRRLERGEAPAAVLESMSHGLTNRLMHSPTRALNDARDPAGLGAAVRRLFRLG
jgi:glutamyl-tRNA reductase